MRKGDYAEREAAFAAERSATRAEAANPDVLDENRDWEQTNGDGLDIQDMRRRCAAHAQWMATHPDVAADAESWADRNLEALPHKYAPDNFVPEDGSHGSGRT
ncbi:hypothetical protein ACWDTP_16165 [Mycobacterium sp. NPDC003449]